jgi:hypothetical protein
MPVPDALPKGRALRKKRLKGFLMNLEQVLEMTMRTALMTSRLQQVEQPTKIQAESGSQGRGTSVAPLSDVGTEDDAKIAGYRRPTDVKMPKVPTYNEVQHWIFTIGGNLWTVSQYGSNSFWR